MTRPRRSPGAVRDADENDGDHATGASYRVVSEVSRHGEQVTIPDDARNVTVQQLGHNGTVRVAYLTRLREVPIGDERGPDATGSREYIY